MRKREAFAGIFAPNFKRAREFLFKIRRGDSSETSKGRFYACIIIQAKMRKRAAFAGIFAPNFKRACDFLLKIHRGVSPEVFVEHFNAHIITYIQQFCNYFYYNSKRLRDRIRYENTF